MAPGVFDRWPFRRTRRYGLFVDGPNLIREEFDVDLTEVREAADAHGHVAIARVYLDHKASAGLIQAAEATGFAVRTTSGDVDVAMSIEATSAIERETIDGVAIASRDLDFKPVLELARERGLATLVIAPSHRGRSAGLVAAADEAIVLEG